MEQLEQEYKSRQKELKEKAEAMKKCSRSTLEELREVYRSTKDEYQEFAPNDHSFGVGIFQLVYLVSARFSQPESGRKRCAECWRRSIRSR